MFIRLGRSGLGGAVRGRHASLASNLNRRIARINFWYLEGRVLDSRDRIAVRRNVPADGAMGVSRTTSRLPCTERLVVRCATAGEADAPL